MKYAIATALFAGLGAAFETITISHFLYVGVNGYPQLSFLLDAQNINCAADKYVLGTTYACDEPSYTFQIWEQQGHNITLSHTVNGADLV
ncbi:hypothetical protein ACEQ8H_008725 [Pleosporales sp. CAS-2024a]